MTFPKPADETSQLDSAGCRSTDPRPGRHGCARPGTASGLLDRDISRFLLDFSIAIHHVAMYPAGHPSLDAVLGTLARRTDLLLQGRPKLAVGVARDRLVIEGVVTAADHSLLRALADRLHRHQLSALCLYRGISAGELSALVKAIAEDPDRGAGALGRRAASQEDGWPHVGLFPLTVGGLELVEPGEGEGAAADRCAVLWVGLDAECETVTWVHREVADHHPIPLIEVEAIVRSLSVAMHANPQMVLPLVALKEFDQYTTTHSLHVSVLAMGLAERLGLGAAAARAYGVAGLLHDIGKTVVPQDILEKPGRLSDAERAVMYRHPEEGARLILASDQDLDLAAIVAHERHVMIDGGGYPALNNHRECHRASRLVHVCDVFDALRTR